MDEALLDDDLDLDSGEDFLAAATSKLRRLMELREQRDLDKTTAENSEKEYRAAEAELWDELDESPLEGAIKVDLGEPYGKVSFSPRETYYGRIIDEDAALEYFEERAMMDEIAKPKIVKKRVSEIVRDCIEQGKSMPPGIDFYAQRGITITKQKN